MKIYSKFGRYIMPAKEAIHFNSLLAYALSKEIKKVTWSIHLMFLDATPYLLYVTTQCLARQWPPF